MRKIVISNCNECPNRGHSGAFTEGGAYPLCRAAKGGQYGGRVLPFEITDDGTGRPMRKYTGEIPNWCPLQRN